MSMLSLLALALATPAAHAGGSALLGVGYETTEADEPETLRLSLRGEAPVIAGDVAGLGAVLPLSMASSGDESLGVSSRFLALELAPSARIRIVPEAVVRPYLDLGLGVLWRGSETETWFGDATSTRWSGMTRSAIGAEIGGTDAGSVSLVLEPFAWQRYGFDDNGRHRFAVMAGISAPL